VIEKHLPSVKHKQPENQKVYHKAAPPPQMKIRHHQRTKKALLQSSPQQG